MTPNSQKVTIFPAHFVNPTKTGQNYRMRKILLCIFIIFIFVSQSLTAQFSVEDSSYRANALNYLVKLYDTTTLENLHLYNGFEPSSYNYQTKGHPFFLTDQMEKGSIWYDGFQYKDRLISYNIFQNEVITMHFNNVYRFSLINDKLQSFSIEDHIFVRLDADSANGSVISTGFYDRLYSGQSVSVFAQRTKSLEEHITAQNLETYFVQHNRYFIKIGETYYSVSNKKSVLKLFGKQKKQIQDFLRKNKIKFRKDREDAMTRIAAFADQSKN